MPTPQPSDNEPGPTGSTPPEPHPTGSPQPDKPAPEKPRPPETNPPESSPTASGDPNGAPNPPAESRPKAFQAADSPQEPHPWIQDQLHATHPEQPKPPESGAPGHPHPEQPIPGGIPPYPQPETTTPAAGPGNTGQPIFSIVSFCCAAVCLVFCPIVFGAAGIILGLIGHHRGERLGKWAALTSVVTLAIGLVLAFVVYKTDAVAMTQQSVYRPRQP